MTCVVVSDQEIKATLLFRQMFVLTGQAAHTHSIQFTDSSFSHSFAEVACKLPLKTCDCIKSSSGNESNTIWAR